MRIGNWAGEIPDCLVPNGVLEYLSQIWGVALAQSAQKRGKMRLNTKQHPPEVRGVGEDAVLGRINLSFAGAKYFL